MCIRDSHRPILRSYWRAFRYHLGSLAFGSLILAIVQAIRLVLAYLHAKAKQTGATKQNKVLEYVFRCLQCCMACFERFIRFLNKVAYIQIALTGKNFIGAAKDGFMLAWNNPLRFAIVQGLGDIFDFLGKIFICFLGTLFGYAIITNVKYYNTRLSSPICPSIAFMLLCYAVGRMFMSVYTMAIDTVLQCFCLDETLQKNKGSANPVWAPEPLKEFFDKNDKNQGEIKRIFLSSFHSGSQSDFSGRAFSFLMQYSLFLAQQNELLHDYLSFFPV
eukprot:TRINITY_DN6088_c0_g1_i2.p1 TRINITY_DN6088_c0_g1~~TRINITY_DN6088_c0_g1_i2.p1  ORF type:complete len:301 (-),score=73.56 TRINITY_DN6088_c0_g1_i2:215-1039(-)